MQLPRELEGGATIKCLSDHLDLAIEGEHRAQVFAARGVTLGDEDSDHASASLRAHASISPTSR